eukprot:g35290.t1
MRNANLAVISLATPHVSRSRAQVALLVVTAERRKLCIFYVQASDSELEDCKREEREGQESKRIGNAWLLAIPIGLWCCIRGYIGWMKLVPLARVCKRLAALVKDPELWKGLAGPVLDLNKFKNSEPLVAWSKSWRESKVSFHQHLNVARCRKVTDAGLAHLSALPLQHFDLAACSQSHGRGAGSLVCAAPPTPRSHLLLASHGRGAGSLVCAADTSISLIADKSRTLGWLTCLRCRSNTSISLIARKSRTRGWLICLRCPSNTSISLIAGKSRTRGWLTCLRCPSNFSISLVAGKSRTRGWLTCLFFPFNSEQLRAGAMDAGLAYLSALPV